MRGRGGALLLCVLILLGGALPAALAQPREPAPGAGKRVALVIGNSAYRHIPALDNPKNDAKLIAGTLAELGFTLVGGGAQIDLDRPSFESAIRDFGRQIGGADVALFYYAGHGLQVRDANWLVPVSANATSVTDVDYELVDADLVLKQMEAARTKLNLVILDACRNNPFSGRGLRDATGGLARMNAPEGTLISYATQPGNVARDGADGNSPYSKALAETMRQPGLEIFQLFNAVGLEVKRITGGEQQPWVSNSPIDGTFFLAGLPPQKAPASVDRFDGVWIGTLTCERVGAALGYSFKFAAMIKAGHFEAQHGVAGQPELADVQGRSERRWQFHRAWRGTDGTAALQSDGSGFRLALQLRSRGHARRPHRLGPAARRPALLGGADAAAELRRRREGRAPAIRRSLTGKSLSGDVGKLTPRAARKCSAEAA